VSRAFRVKGLNALTRRGGKGGGGWGLRTSNIQDPRSHGLSGLLITAYLVGSASRACARARAPPPARVRARAPASARAKLGPTAPPHDCGRLCLVHGCAPTGGRYRQSHFKKSSGRSLRLGLALESPGDGGAERRWSVTFGHASSASRKHSIRETRPEVAFHRRSAPRNSESGTRPYYFLSCCKLRLRRCALSARGSHRRGMEWFCRP
jgi:hypothetical protein